MIMVEYRASGVISTDTLEHFVRDVRCDAILPLLLAKSMTGEMVTVKDLATLRPKVELLRVWVDL